jgi:hypothetical protein
LIMRVGVNQPKHDALAVDRSGACSRCLRLCFRRSWAVSWGAARALTEDSAPWQRPCCGQPLYHVRGTGQMVQRWLSLSLLLFGRKEELESEAP